MGRRQHSLTTQRILGWAGAHYKRTGRWPTNRLGRVRELPDEDWRTIDRCLEFGGLGLPGGSSLAYLLARHRGIISGEERPRLSMKLILVWADRRRIRTGEYPNQNSGRVKGVRGETWRKIDNALRDGNRGLLGGSSLAKLLSKHRGKALGGRRPVLQISEILAWADAYHRRTGRWPNRSSGRIRQAPTENWSAIDSALKTGTRQLRGDTTLAGLLVERRGAVIARHKKPLTINGVLRWADRHKKRTGAWPTAMLGTVEGVVGETWKAIDAVLSRGGRGLPGGCSISQLLGAHRAKPLKKRLPRVLVSRILAWADRHRRRTGDWPSIGSGTIKDAPHETWQRIDQSLRYGYIRARGADSLPRLLAKHRGRPLPKPPSRLTIPRILKWADAHFKRTGRWPSQNIGPVISQTGESWKRIDSALREGNRELRGGTSLGRLLAKRRNKSPKSQGPRLTSNRILAWADRHHARTGRWPAGGSGPIIDAVPETWNTVSEALRIGRRGLPGGSSIAKLLARRGRKRNEGQLPRLTTAKILAWADRHRRRTGDLPDQRSGAVKDAPEETWRNLNAALYSGVRGLPGGDSLARLLAKHRGKPIRGRPLPERRSGRKTSRK